MEIWDWSLFLSSHRLWSTRKSNADCGFKNLCSHGLISSPLSFYITYCLDPLLFFTLIAKLPSHGEILFSHAENFSLLSACPSKLKTQILQALHAEVFPNLVLPSTPNCIRQLCHLCVLCLLSGIYSFLSCLYYSQMCREKPVGLFLIFNYITIKYPLQFRKLRKIRSWRGTLYVY